MIRAEEFKFDEFRQQTSRWSNRAITPLRFDSRDDMAKEVVLLHPGWGKRPEMLKFIMDALARRGKMPIGLDTRNGYADSQATGVGLLHQRYRVGSKNKYFPDSSQWQNRYSLRRPTAVLALVEALEIRYDTEIRSASLFGHSEGGRVMSLVASAPHSKLHTSKLVVANSVGAGHTQGAKGQLKSSLRKNELFFASGFDLLTEAIPSVIESASYAVTHPRRWSREKQVIETYDIWDTLDELVLDTGIDTTVMHATHDMVISFESAELAARGRPHITFIPTEGGHSNIYTPSMAWAIADQFSQAA